MILWIFVLARIISNPISNVLQKLLARDGATPLFIILASYSMLGILCAPFLAVVGMPASMGFWRDIIISALLAVLSNATLVAALKESDLSILGPINSYKAIVSLVPGMIMLGEIPSAPQLGGMGFIVIGSWLVLKTNDLTKTGISYISRGVILRFAALILSAVEAVYLKRAILAATPGTAFISWSALVVAWLLILLPFFWKQIEMRKGIELLKGAKWSYILLTLTTGIMQLSSLVTFKYLPVGPALALFQTSTLITVVLGWTVFNEKHFMRRLGGAAVMIAGALVIMLGS